MGEVMEVFNWMGDPLKKRYIYSNQIIEATTGVAQKLVVIDSLYSTNLSKGSFRQLEALVEHCTKCTLDENSNSEQICQFINAYKAKSKPFSLLTKHIYFTYGINKQNGDFYIYDSKVVKFLKHTTKYQDKKCYKHYASAMKSLKDGRFQGYSNREMDLIIWNAVKYAEKYKASSMSEFLQKDIKEIVEKIKNVPNK